MSLLARTTDLPASHEGAFVASHQDHIRDTVAALLIAAGPDGLTDRELTIRFFARKSHPECELSSPRKRRSELTRDGIALTKGHRRKVGSERVAGTVWYHRNATEQS